jgi:D-arabinose 1-dehydrogenase-like Zn-dependent alcohol dehydrogenase
MRFMKDEGVQFEWEKADEPWYCLSKHNITADIEVIPIQKVNEAYERLSRADVKYRFSIDMASLRS